MPKEPYHSSHKTTIQQTPVKAWTGQPYPAYKDSGVEWLGKVPQSWTMFRLKGVVANVTDLTRELDDDNIYLALEHVESWTGKFSVMNNSIDFDSQAKRFQSRDVLFGKLRPYLAKVVCPGRDGICAGEFLVLRPRHSGLLSKYLEQLLRSKPVIFAIDASTFGAKMPRADWQFIGNMRIPLPPLPEQHAIAYFLDHANQRIQRHIHAKEKLIKLLEEQKQVIIHEAVTGQIDIRTGQPYPAYKESGVEWLGKVPEHWEVLPLKRWVSTRITDGPHETPDLLPAGIPFLSAEAVSDGHLDFNRRRGFISQETHEMYCLKCRPQRGDIFMCKSGATTGKVAMVETDDEFSVWSPLALIRVDAQKVIAKLLLRVLQSRYLQGQVRDMWSYGTQPNLAMRTMERLVIALPSLDEQRAILRWLDGQLLQSYRSTDLAKRKIQLLHEYRTRLIADVVTGKLDVREAAAELPGHEPSTTDNTCQDGMALAAQVRSRHP